jgi:hypothetical protein
VFTRELVTGLRGALRAALRALPPPPSRLMARAKPAEGKRAKIRIDTIHGAMRFMAERV